MVAKMKPDVYEYDDIKLGDTFQFEHMFLEGDINKYARLTGDFNPLHINRKYARSTVYKKRIAHGMLTASLFSTLLGMYCPGRDSIILSMDVNFKRPVFLNVKLHVRGEVTGKINALKIIVMKLSVSDSNHILVEGIAKVKKF